MVKLKIAFFVCWAGVMIGFWFMNSGHISAGKLIGTGFGLVAMAIAFYLFFLYLKDRFGRSIE